MATTTQAAAGKTRKAGVGAPALTNHINSSTSEDSSTNLRLQFLIARFGLNAVRAPLVAALIWGTNNG
ncbi:hypothetical protein [uncultured Sphingomonas sp.]|uniref:hypothetical protein n=1 Tax=uncultured Sphingomonas sp. TaxID=158754 RepID=UPI002623E801|nr:hypothetical protein [uncultured Sphingomonas sp.]